MSSFIKLIYGRTVIVPTNMHNGNNENALIKILINVFDVEKNWLRIQAQVVAVKPINKLHCAIVGGRRLIVVNSVHEFSGIRYHDSSKRLFQIAIFHVNGKPPRVPKEDVQG